MHQPPFFSLPSTFVAVARPNASAPVPSTPAHAYPWYRPYRRMACAQSFCMLGIDSPFGNGAYGLCALSYSADPSTFFNPSKASSFVSLALVIAQGPLRLLLVLHGGLVRGCWPQRESTMHFHYNFSAAWTDVLVFSFVFSEKAFLLFGLPAFSFMFSHLSRN